MRLRPELPRLAEHHDIGGFRCGAIEIDDWFQKRARKGQLLGNANVFVFVHDGAVLGFYALATGGVELSSAPGSVHGNAPTPVPVLLLARLGVDDRAQGWGIGRLLVQDALLRCLEIADNVGFRALLIHCRDQAARDFYLNLVPSFASSPTEPMHLFLALKALQDAAPDTGDHRRFEVVSGDRIGGPGRRSSSAVRSSGAAACGARGRVLDPELTDEALQLGSHRGQLLG